MLLRPLVFPTHTSHTFLSRRNNLLPSAELLQVRKPPLTLGDACGVAQSPCCGTQLVVLGSGLESRVVLGAALSLCPMGDRKGQQKAGALL